MQTVIGNSLPQTIQGLQQVALTAHLPLLAAAAVPFGGCGGVGLGAALAAGGKGGGGGGGGGGFLAELRERAERKKQKQEQGKAAAPASFLEELRSKAQSRGSS